MPKTLRFIAFWEDREPLEEHWDHPDAPTQTYGLTGGGFYTKRSVVLRRYNLWPGEARIADDSYEKLVADLAGHTEAHLLMLKPGEFFALQVNAWRHRHYAVHGGMLPTAHWSALDLLGLYKRVRAVSAKRRDDAKSIEEARQYFRQKYEPDREMLRRTYRQDTVH